MGRHEKVANRKFQSGYEENGTLHKRTIMLSEIKHTYALSPVYLIPGVCPCRVPCPPVGHVKEGIHDTGVVGTGS